LNKLFFVKYFLKDYHAVGNQMPETDPNQDWTLHSATEDGTCTVLTFSRAFDTCDPQDYPITVNFLNKYAMEIFGET